LDLDGTLVDSASDICRHINATLAASGRAVLQEQHIRPHIGRGALALMRSLVPDATPAILDELTQDYRRRYQQAPLVECVLYPGAVELLTALHGAGILTALVTNKPQEIAQAMLEQLGVSRWFSSVQGALDGRAHKPDPEALRQACVAAGASVETTVMVGDSVVDLETALAFGCGFVGVGHGIDGGAGLRARGVSLCEGLAQVGQRVLAPSGAPT
jgi:phosphoglycolate phosphatase